MAELLACNVSSALEALYHDHHVNTANGFKGHKCFLKKTVIFSLVFEVTCCIFFFYGYAQLHCFSDVVLSHGSRMFFNDTPGELVA